jgi:hypothetical protein
MSDYPECDEAELLVKGCDFPWIRPDFDTEKCSQTYAERISPYHTNCCAIYGTISGLLWVSKRVSRILHSFFGAYYSQGLFSPCIFDAHTLELNIAFVFSASPGCGL